MTRTIATISCLIAALLLVPIQGGCIELPEHELVTDMECYVVVSSSSQSQVAEELPKLLPISDSARHNLRVSVKIHNQNFNLPIRILNCVFRE